MKISYTTASILIIIIACFLVIMDYKDWRKTERVIQHDVRSYYGYLPAKYIYNDIKVEKADYGYAENGYWFWLVDAGNGKMVFRMSCGLAILYSPFFFAADIAAGFFEYPETGFSEPYKFFLLLSTLFYLFAGLWYVKKILGYFAFGNTVISVTLLILGLGTNIFCYSTSQAPMSHVYSFCLFAMFIYYSILWHERKTKVLIPVLALLFGLISLIRLSDSILIIFFLLYGIQNLYQLSKLKSVILPTTLICILALVVWIPQFLYWKTVTGNFIVQSYNDQARFFFTQPEILKGLFSFRKGWLVYTPVMIFSIAGLFMLNERFKKIKLPLISFFILNIYIIFSWWCWWYGGTLGQRSLIESYALLAIPLAVFTEWILQKHIAIKSAFICIVIFFMWLNIFQTYQFETGAMHYDAMTRELYFKQFGKRTRIPDFDRYLDYPDYEAALKGNR